MLQGAYLDAASGAIDNRGGIGVTTGGTLKLFYIEHLPGTYNTGRLFLKQYALPETGTIFEF
jgi:hypothetical protein